MHLIRLLRNFIIYEKRLVHKLFFVFSDFFWGFIEIMALIGRFKAFAGTSSR